ncbi:hypothetical protein DFH09DRAFT_910970, partial [Mycena vulgaris]
ETLRFYPSEALTERIVTRDTALPLSVNITTNARAELRSLTVEKGTLVSIAVGSYHRLDTIWVPDADEFKPERWFKEAVCKGDSLGPYAHLWVSPTAASPFLISRRLSFHGRPHTCLG